MDFFQAHLLTLVVFVPAAFALLVALFPASEAGQIRTVTFIGMLVGFGLTLYAYFAFNAGGPEFQLQEKVPWLPDLGIGYHLGTDGLAISLVLLTGFLGPAVVLGSLTYVKERVKEFHLALLLLQTAMLGALCAMDVLLFYIFFEAMLVPMYLLIGVWGSEERQKAALKFFLYTMAGSLLMLVAILSVYFMAQYPGMRTFDYATLYNALAPANRALAACVHDASACQSMPPLAVMLQTYGPWLFFAFAIAFAIKVPMFPVHTWLPDAHVQAPTAGSVILAGVMLKMGTFGFWRYAIPFFPVAAQQYRMVLALLAVVGIVYGALMSLAQRDVKKLIAYSSVSHLGFCVLGMFAATAEGATGSAYQMLNHGISTGALFLLFGYLYERRHTRLMSDYGGIARVVPLYTALFLIITFSSIAVPGTNGFIGEFLILMGSFKADWSARILGMSGLHLSVLAATAIVLGAAYMLWMVQRVFFGPTTHPDNEGISDLSFRELITALPFVVLVLWMGLMPQPFLDRLAPSSDRFVRRAAVGRGATPDAVLIQAETLARAPNAP